MNMIQRAQSPTPQFFKKLRTIGLGLATLSTAVLTLPVVLPSVIVTVAGYTAVAGTVLGGVSQLTVAEDAAKDVTQKAKGKKKKDG
ncbi:MAG: hypothetical protein KGO81_15165 [Bacteroidota bacterium]|nr:hypothetical protein [Bacteroidota bacterium]